MTDVRTEDSQPGAEYESPLRAALRACEECHRKKTKCDMARPTCGLCRRTGSICQFPVKRRLPAKSYKRQKIDLTATDDSLSWMLNFFGETDITHLTCGPAQALRTPLESSVNVNFGASETAPLIDRALERAGTENPVADSRPKNHLLTPAQPLYAPISYDLAMDLVETFFLHIQPWLPILHRPRFVARCMRQLRQGSDALAQLPPDMKLLLNSMFALSARFSSSPAFALSKPLERDSNFVSAARQAYAALRATDDPSLTYLQGCILLAFHAYTAELNSAAWILTGVCVRLAYDLGLSEIDDESANDRGEEDHVGVEEMRRAWWLTWELDTFGSMVTQRPFAVDRHHFTVNLPISDADWFANKDTKSTKLLTTPDKAWTSLQHSENQDPRAWFLITNHLFSLLFKYHERRRKGSKDYTADFTIAFNCLKLSLPSSFNILSEPPVFEPSTFATCNWILGTHLMLMCAYSQLESINVNDGHAASPLSVSSQDTDASTRVRSVAFSQLIARWPPEYMAAAHPFFICMLLPTHSEVNDTSSGLKGKSSFEQISNMAELAMMRFAERWGLATETLVVLKEMRNPGGNLGTDAALRRRFATFFPRKNAAQRPRLASGSESDSNVVRRSTNEQTTEYFQGYSPSWQEGSAGGTEQHDVPEPSQQGGNTDQQDITAFGLTPSMALPETIFGGEVDQDSIYSFQNMLGDMRENVTTLH